MKYYRVNRQEDWKKYWTVDQAEHFQEAVNTWSPDDKPGYISEDQIMCMASAAIRGRSDGNWADRILAVDSVEACRDQLSWDNYGLAIWAEIWVTDIRGNVWQIYGNVCEAICDDSCRNNVTQYSRK